MIVKMRLKSTFRHGNPVLAVSLFLLALSAAPVFAEQSYLAAGHPDGTTLLCPPPLPGSAEEAADLATVRSVFQSKTAAENATAMKDSGLSFSLFALAIGAGFDLDKLPKTGALLKKVKQEIAAPINTAKEHFKRLRPYQLDQNLNVGTPESSFGYPSGHSTRGTVYALVIAELFPEKRDTIMAIGRQIGWDRVVLARHYPTDIYAGRVLGQAIVRELRVSSAFQYDLAEAKAEIGAARRAAVPAEATAQPAGEKHGTGPN